MSTKALALFLVASCLLACGSDNGFLPGPDAGMAIDSGQAEAAGPAAITPVTMFVSSACKKEAAAKSAMARTRLMVIGNEAGLEGLSCVAWQRIGAGEVKVDLYNYESACANTWAGDAAVAANGTLELHVDNPSCLVMTCGKCLYDWSFDVQATLPAQATPVSLSVTTCNSQQQLAQLSASLGAADQGIACTFADYGALNWQASATGTCGKTGMPCVGSLLCGTGSFTSTGTCDSGLVCDSSAAVNEPRCLVPCTTTADCPRADAWSCQSGLCRPAG